MNLNEMDDVDEEVIDDTMEEVEEGEVEEVVEGEGEMFDILEDISSFLQPGSQEIKVRMPPDVEKKYFRSTMDMGIGHLGI